MIKRKPKDYSKLEIMKGFVQVYNNYVSTMDWYIIGKIPLERYTRMITVCNRLKHSWQELWIQRFNSFIDGKDYVEGLSETLEEMIINSSRKLLGITISFD